MYEERWYWCQLIERDLSAEPDWSKVPEHKRDSVRARWEAGRPDVQSRVQLWGPQIPMYERTRHMRVVVYQEAA